ncbi:MAG: hypothetical protein L0271_12220 [Gemmatimonadetes bacterium]|nr:hypothetical protein [Gemmatimonadota bacterium]
MVSLDRTFQAVEVVRGEPGFVFVFGRFTQIVVIEALRVGNVAHVDECTADPVPLVRIEGQLIFVASVAAVLTPPALLLCVEASRRVASRVHTETRQHDEQPKKPMAFMEGLLCS